MTNQSLQFYQQFSALLHQMREQLHNHDMFVLRQSLLSGQQLFQEYLNSESNSSENTSGHGSAIHSAIPGIDAAKLQSILTEMNRDLRLLNTDVMLLQAARQNQTLQQRTIQVGDRLQRLIQFCDFILDNAQPPSDSDQAD